MKKNEIVLTVVCFIIYTMVFFVIYEVYDQNVAIIDRGYPSTENTFFALSFGWVPIALTCAATAVFTASIVAHLAKRGELSFKKEAGSIAFEIIVGVIYALPVLAITRGISTVAYKALLITSCVVFALYLVYRCIDLLVKACKRG